MKLPIYMDYQATTPLDPRVLDAMLPYFTEKFGNPASRQHRFGWEADDAVERARTAIAHALHAEPRELIFTSGATEGNNLAIKGIAEGRKQAGNHIITAQTEHKSVLDVCKKMERYGFDVTYLPVDESGLVDPSQLESAITPRTILVTIMTANNEIGTIQEIGEIGKICRQRNVIFHTDATQALGKIPLDVRALQCDLLTFSGHKIYGPKGVGALFICDRQPKIQLSAQLEGGGHERNLRSGTLNVPGIVGLGKSVEIALAGLEQESARLQGFRDKLWNGFTSRLDEVYLNGHPTRRLPNNLNVSFCYVEDNVLMMNMKNIALSTGSACSSSSPSSSHVIRALHVGREREQSALRFGVGRYTTEEEVEYVIENVVENVRKLRTLSPSYVNRKRVSTAQEKVMP